MLSFLKIIRLPNLIIMAITMLSIRYGVIAPIAGQYGLSLAMPSLHFDLLICVVLLIAASGYLINDYFDIETDAINKPEKVVIGKTLRKSLVMPIYIGMNGVGLLAGGWVCFANQMMSFWIIFPITIGALWFYSTTYKQQFLIGNVIVAIVTAFVPLLPAIFDIPLMLKLYQNYLLQYELNLNVIFYWTGTFSFFAFWMTLLREWIKDLEDEQGDTFSGRNTLPIVAGLRGTYAAIVSVSAIVILSVLYLFYNFLRTDFSGKFDYPSFLYILLLIILPILLSNAFLFFKTILKRYTYASMLMKCAMVTGILFAWMVRFKLSN